MTHTTRGIRRGALLLAFGLALTAGCSRDASTPDSPSLDHPARIVAILP